jgi:hypothetical protein
MVLARMISHLNGYLRHTRMSFWRFIGDHRGDIADGENIGQAGNPAYTVCFACLLPRSITVFCPIRSGTIPITPADQITFLVSDHFFRLQILFR